jgi:hypothetical protein
MEREMPGCYHGDSVQYTTVAGKYLFGQPLGAKDATWEQKVVGAGYFQVRGELQ